jgi:hypothetical protein
MPDVDRNRKDIESPAGSGVGSRFWRPIDAPPTRREPHGWVRLPDVGDVGLREKSVDSTEELDLTKRPWLIRSLYHKVRLQGQLRENP